MRNIKFARTIVLIAVIYNTCGILTLLIPGGLEFAGVKLPYSSFWVWFPALFASFATIVLLLSSRNIEKYASFAYWNGIIRLTFVAIAFALNFQASVGSFILLLAVGDLPLGLLCVFGLPRALKKTHFQLLTDK